MATRSTDKPYKVKEALLPKEDGGYLQRWYIYRDFLPIDAINQFLHRKSGRSSGTGKTYAYGLEAWLNFLHRRNTEYHEATLVDIETFKDHLAYGLHSNSLVLKIKSEITYSTLARIITTIQAFYRWFEGKNDWFLAPEQGAKYNRVMHKQNQKVFLYGQIYEKQIDEIIDASNLRLKPSGFKKHWLTEKEKSSILACFRTGRDKAIFMLLCEGMRIDEVLSIKYAAYDNSELTVRPSRSKGYSDEYEDKFRIVAFHDRRTAEHIDRYIQTERADVEAIKGEYLEMLFVNLKNHPGSYGKPISYRNWWGVLKTAVRKAGINPSEISTHVGRRSFIQEKLEEGEDPEMIRQLVGWASLEPLDAYRDCRSKVVIKNAAERRRSRWVDKCDDGKGD